LLHGEAEDELECVVLAREDGELAVENPLALPVLRPGEEALITVPFPAEKKPGREYTITFSLRLKNSRFYAPKGYEAGAWQFLLGKEAGPVYAAPPAPGGKLEIAETDAGWVLKTGNGVTAEVSRKTGLITALAKGGKPCLKSAARPCLNRPITGLDLRPGWGWYDDYEKVRRLENRLTASRVLKGAGEARIEFDFVMERENTPAIPGKIAYTFHDSGRITTAFQIHVDAGIAAIPRAGVEMVLPEGFENIEYYGCGPGENYPDRLLAGILAVHKSTVTEEHFPFVPPSECGGHEKTRRLVISRPGAEALRIRSSTPFHFDARHSAVEDYLAAAHDHELIRRAETFVHIDAAHGPIGSDMAWSSVMPAAHALGGGSYHLEFELEIV
jgi:beta-galactosidase